MGTRHWGMVTRCARQLDSALGEVPRIAGLQPVYTARQLICMQNGSSAGTAVALMKKAVSNLSEDDIISISAYLGSLAPR